MPEQEWNIKTRGAQCGRCDAAFADGDLCVSMLSFGDAGYERFDFCQDCWARREENQSLVSVWRGVFKESPPPAPEPVERDTAEKLLRRVMACNDEASLNVIFILAVMLERRRVLVERKVELQPDGARVRVYEHRDTGETFIVKDPMLHMDKIEDVQREVLAMLENSHAAPELQ